MAANKSTKNLPGAVGVSSNGGLVKLDDVTNTQGRTIPDATPKNSGVMTKTQASQLAALVAGGGGGGFVPWVDVSTFPGGDLGAQIRAADAFIGNAPGMLLIPSGNYVWTTHVNTPALRPNRTLWFGSGIITCIGTDPGISTADSVDNVLPGVNTLTPDAMSAPGWAIKVGDILTIGAEQVVVTAITATTFTAAFTQAHNAPFAINGYYQGPMLTVQDDTTIYGNGPATIFDEPDSGVVFATVDSSGIEIRDFTIQNIANTPGLNDGSSLPNVGFGNGKHCKIERVSFINTRSLGVSIGSDSAGGTQFADDIDVYRCTFDGVKNIVSACVNGQNIRFTENFWYRCNGLCLDFEPNTPDDRISNWIIAHNVFDFRGSAQQPAGIEVQHIQTGPGEITNNVLVSDDYPTQTASTGIVVDGTHDVLVQGNVLTGYYFQTPVYVLHATRTKVHGNHLMCSSAGFDHLLTIGDNSVDCDISSNTLIVPPGGVGLCGIVESPTGTANNVYHDNVIDARQDTTSQVPSLILGAATSTKWDNLLNGVLEVGLSSSVLDLPSIATAFAPVLNNATATTSVKFYPTQSRSIVGLKFYWNSLGVPWVVKATIYAPDGTVLATANVNVDAVGEYTVMFAAPVALVAGNAYYAAIFETTGQFFQTGVDTTGGLVPLAPVFAGGDLVYIGYWFVNADGVPDTNNGGAAAYPILPILQ